MLAPGAIIAERYRLDRQLGAGGMGVVWSARHLVTRQAVALKFLKDPESDPNTRRRFLREARAACAVHHGNVVQIHDVIEADGMPVIVMEMLEGESLGGKLRREKKLDVEGLARVMLPVVSAVGTAHAIGIVHRDLKPDNIFLANVGEEIVVKVLDFGVAKLTALEGDAEKTAGLTTTGSMVGTPYYMSPEQAFGERDIDHRSDIWALGIIFYRCLSGFLPTRRENVGQVLKVILSNGIPPVATQVPDLPEDVAELIGRMLTPDRQKRPADLREVQAVLRRHCEVPIVAFGSAIRPPPSSGRLLPTPDDDSHASRTSVASPVARAARTGDPGAGAPAEAPATVTDPMAPGATTVPEPSIAILVESAAGHATTLPGPSPSSGGARWWARIGVVAVGIAGASAIMLGSRGRWLDRPAALSSAPPPASTPLPPAASIEPLAPAASAPATATPAPSASARPEVVSTGRPAAKKPSRTSPPASVAGPAAAPPSPPKPTTPDVFVNKPPF